MPCQPFTLALATCPTDTTIETTALRKDFHQMDRECNQKQPTHPCHATTLVLEISPTMRIN